MDTKSIVLEHLTTAIQVFLGTFLVVVGAMLHDAHTVVWSWAFFYPILATGATAAIKEVAAKFFTEKLGGRAVGSKTLLGARK